MMRLVNHVSDVLKFSLGRTYVNILIGAKFMKDENPKSSLGSSFPALI